MQTPRLNTLAEKYRTDKCVKFRHNYIPFYELLLRRRYIRNLLEIGIGYPQDMPHVQEYAAGASLRMWEEYLPLANIYGADINRNILFQSGRINTFYGDQCDPESLLSIVKKINARIDIIIDDGCHGHKHQLEAAKTLLPHLALDGAYVIEDVSDKVIVADGLQAIIDSKQVPGNFDVAVHDFKLHHDDCIVVVQNLSVSNF